MRLIDPQKQFDAPKQGDAAPWHVLVAVMVLVAVTLVAYGNTLHCPFVFDDYIDILDNRSIRQLWPLWPIFAVHDQGRTALHGRPVVNLSLAINYAMALDRKTGRVDPLWFHRTNLAIHLLAGLTLFGIVRRTLLLPQLRPRYGPAAVPLALAVAMIWLLHPLHTSAVTYLTQRYESLMGMFYLLTLYCAIRCATRCPLPSRPTVAALCPADCPPPPAHRPRLTAHRCWAAAAVLSCLLALGCKEVAISAPLVVLLYDRAFLGGTFREAWRRRWPLYVGLLGAWLAFALLLLYSGSRGTWAGYGLRTSWQEYALSQFGVIVHYLRLSLWPSPLVLDYGWPVPRTVGAILPAALVVAMLLAATVYGLVRWPRWGFLGACFFLILAPTSTILPLNCLSCEYRMYLPLAAAVAAVVLGGYLGCARLLLLPSRSGRRAVSRGWAMPWAVPAATLAAVALALGYATRQRNGDYRSLLVIWQDTVEKRPQNFHARTDLGVALAAVGKTSEAIEHYQRSLQLQPDYADAHANLGNALARLGRTREAIEHYRIAVQVDPANALAHYNLGSVFASEGNLSEAIEHYQAALRLEPDDVKAHNDLGVALAAIGKIPEATEHYQQVLQRQPDHAEAHTNLGNVLARSGRIREAIEHYQTAVQLDPANALVHYNLGTAFLDEGNLSQAIEQYRKVLRLKADYAAAHYMLGSLLARVGRTKEAIEQYGQLLPSAPHFADAQHNLAWLLATCEPKDGGDAAGAVQLAERACQQDKQDSRDDPQRLDTLAAAYAAAGRFPEAVTTARQAIQLAESAGQTALAKEIQSRCELYRAGRPYRAAAAEHTH